MVTVLDKSLENSAGLRTPLILIDGRVGLMQTQFTALVEITPIRMSNFLRDLNLERQYIGRADAKVLKKFGIVKLHGKGNFLPLQTIQAILQELDSDAAKKVRHQIDSETAHSA